ncbi:hypothetical protein HETIRDRAFT_410322 [Heterobasidion irregulare TC 32-1]|uniref:Uncharacterized protein n=1 Tax=Heterobasidion irregulare (strain TC 32-1) TaxID=747525 RepID=W4K1G1_HETIT|nr:uncharacterized protein HETIRDRAFT_410322 [Heterobasidion irregulare TC 32-1]ETW79559.1 hypothetical protein HETIRDRAFT_410322 [Heterobasidion irregulare TC 32-1]
MVRAGRGGENCITTSWTQHWLGAARDLHNFVSDRSDRSPLSPRGYLLYFTAPALRHAQRSPLPVDRYLPGPEGRSTHSKVFVSCSRPPWTIGHVRPRFD